MKMIKFEGMKDNTFICKIVETTNGQEDLIRDVNGAPARFVGMEAQALLEFFNKRQDAQPTTDAEQAIVNIIG